MIFILLQKLTNSDCRAPSAGKKLLHKQSTVVDEVMGRQKSLEQRILHEIIYFYVFQS